MRNIMNILGIYYGFAGAIPFVVFATLSFALGQGSESLALVSFLQISYAGLILSFLGGIHWGQAIYKDNKKQFSIAMAPTLAAFATLWVYALYPAASMLIASILFWVMYATDKRIMPADMLPEGYHAFRLRLTIIVSTALFLTFIALL